MTDLSKIFQIEKNNEEIRRTVLTNVIHMLTERKLLNRENLSENINNLINTESDDLTYLIDISKNEEKKEKIALKLLNQKITAISKQSNISDFLNKYKDYHKIVVVKSISTKALQYILNNFSKTEVFLEKDLMINLVDHIFVPKYELIDPDTEDYNKFCNIFFCKKRDIPRLPITDPVAKYYNLKRGNIVRVIRPSETTGYSSSYRLVI